MKTIQKFVFVSFSLLLFSVPAPAQLHQIDLENLPYKIYPDINDTRPDLPSPFVNTDHEEHVIAVTKENKYAIIPVTLSNNRKICRQLVIDSTDFPHLAQTGLHSEEELDRIRRITGRPLEQITELGMPDRLSQAGFLARDENIISVIRGDNRIVSQLSLTHPQLAKPLFHVLNMMDTDLELNRWNMARHRWENIQYFFYNHRTVFVDVGDTKGGQLSIFDDGIEGGFHIRLWRELDADELHLLKNKYGHLSAAEFDSLETLLCRINTGEIEPQYIMRYGFYEGHTFWRTDPITICVVFGLKTLFQIEEAFAGRLFKVLTGHFVAE